MSCIAYQTDSLESQLRFQSKRSPQVLWWCAWLAMQFQHLWSFWSGTFGEMLPECYSWMVQPIKTTRFFVWLGSPWKWFIWDEQIMTIQEDFLRITHIMRLWSQDYHTCICRLFEFVLFLVYCCWHWLTALHFIIFICQDTFTSALDFVPQVPPSSSSYYKREDTETKRGWEVVIYSAIIDKSLSQQWKAQQYHYVSFMNLYHNNWKPVFWFPFNLLGAFAHINTLPMFVDGCFQK